MAEPSLVTVVIPTWNRRELVGQAVASVIAQTYPHWELVVVDDGSTDGTCAHLRTLEEPRLKISAVPHSGNVARLRNLGVAAGAGDWVAFLDADDAWLPVKLEMQVHALGKSGADWCYSNYGLMDETGAAIVMRAGDFRPLSGWIAGDLLADRTNAYVGTLVIRRRLFDALGGFDERLHYLEDLELELRLAEAAEAVAVADALARVRDHPGRRTSEMTRIHEHAAEAFERIARRQREPALARLARRKRAHHLAEAGAQRMSRGELWPGARFLLHALMLRDDPGHWLRAATRSARKRASQVLDRRAGKPRR